MAEKSINEIPRGLREQFERGMAAYHKENLDYAIALFTDVLQKEPAFYDCREALRAAQHKRRTKTSLFRKLQASPALARAQLALRTNPTEALHQAELVLNDDPRNPAAHDLLARAAMSVGLARTAVLSLEILFRNAPGDRDVAMKLAKALIAAGQIERADKIYADLLAARPDDLEVARAYKDLGASRTIADRGYAAAEQGPGSYRETIRDKEEALSLEQEARQVKSDDVADRLLAEYKARLESEPQNLKLLRNIADLYTQKKDFERALAAYQQIIDIEGRNDPSLEKAIADVRIMAFDDQIARLDPTAPDYAEQRSRIERERDEFALKDCQSRAERYPMDLGIRFELGQLYFKAGRITEAIQELQKAQSNPHRRIPALGLLAKCFARRGMFDLASRSLQTAIREKPVFDDEKKDLIYELGCAYEKMGRKEDAVEQFKLIYENDITFRDVAARVDAYYAEKAEG